MIFKTPDKVTIKKGFQYLIMSKSMIIFTAKLSGGQKTLYSSKGYVPNDSIKYILVLDLKFYDKCFLISEKLPDKKTRVIAFIKAGRFVILTYTDDGRFYDRITDNFLSKSEIIRWSNIPGSESA